MDIARVTLEVGPDLPSKTFAPCCSGFSLTSFQNDELVFIDAC